MNGGTGKDPANMNLDLIKFNNDLSLTISYNLNKIVFAHTKDIYCYSCIWSKPALVTEYEFLKIHKRISISIILNFAYFYSILGASRKSLPVGCIC